MGRLRLGLSPSWRSPLFEELCFRGLAFAAMAKASAERGLPAVPGATIGSALLFALVHVEPVRIPVLLMIGLVARLRGRVPAGSGRASSPTP